MDKFDWVRAYMNHKRYRVMILATALIIIGTRGLSMAQFSQRASIQKSDTQEWNDVQLAIPINKSTDLLLFGMLRFERVGGGFTSTFHLLTNTSGCKPSVAARAMKTG